MLGIVVRIRADSVEVRLPTVEWQGVSDPVCTSRAWQTIPLSEATEDALQIVFAEGLRVREAEYIPCAVCGRSTPPEHRDGDTCHGCAERVWGVVH